MAKNKRGKDRKTEVKEYATPLEAPYVQKLIFNLTLIGAWPHEALGHKMWFAKYRNAKHLVWFWIITISSCFLFVKKNLGVLNFLILGRGYITLLMGLVLLQRLYSRWTVLYRDISEDFFLKFHLFYFKEKNEYAKKVYDNVERIATIFTNIFHIELYLGVILYNFTPLYNNYSRGMFRSDKPANGTYDQAVDLLVPFDQYSNFKGFLVVYLNNLILTFDGSCWFVAIDLYISIIVFHIWGHIKILKYNLRNFPLPKMRGTHSNPLSNPPWYDNEESNEIKALLVDSVKHFKLIKTFMDKMAMSFGLTICTYYCFHQLTECILLVELSQLTPQAFGTYATMTLVLFQQFIQMNVVFELIATESETIKDAVYDVPWECMDTKNRKIVLIYLCNVKEPMELKALGVLPVGVKTMASVIKTSLSYFMLLNSSVSR